METQNNMENDISSKIDVPLKEMTFVKEAIKNIKDIKSLVSKTHKQFNSVNKRINDLE